MITISVGIGWTDEQKENLHQLTEILLEDFQIELKFTFNTNLTNLFTFPGISENKSYFIWLMYSKSTTKFHALKLDMSFTSCDYNFYAAAKNQMVGFVKN